MAGVRLIGVTLCFGLMLEGIWPASLKPYFALYWFITVGYCLPFSGTLSFLRVHEGPMDTMLWVASFGLLIALLDSSSFVVLGLLGSGLALGGWRLGTGSLPVDLWSETNVAGLLLILFLMVGVLLLGSRKEGYTWHRLYWHRVANHILGHEMRNPLGILQGVGVNMKHAFGEMEKTKNESGKEGYWMPTQWYGFFKQFPDIMVAQSEEGKKDIKCFKAFVQQQVFGSFDKKERGVCDLVKEGIEKEIEKVGKYMKIETVCKKDFKAAVVEGVFPSVIGNIVRNASIHGRASHIEIKVDGVQRTISIRDDGDGIAPDVLPRIFDLHYTTTTEKKGSGVGLAFVKMVIEASGGKISCYSRHGTRDSFTEFEIVLPQG